MHIYFNKKFILVNNEVSRYFIYFKITIHILPNISQSNLKFGQVMEYNKRNIFLQKVCTNAQNEAGRLVSDLFFVFKKALYRVKQKWSAKCVDSPRLGMQ